MDASAAKRGGIGWVVFDQGDREPGPFLAARISDNEGDDVWKDCSSNVLILTLDTQRVNCYRRVGIGEIIKSSLFAVGGHPVEIIQIS
jgi:hypothetical protein